MYYHEFCKDVQSTRDLRPILTYLSHYNCIFVKFDHSLNYRYNKTAITRSKPYICSLLLP